MPFLYSDLGLLGGSVLIAMLMTTDGAQGQTATKQAELSSSAGEVAQRGLGSVEEKSEEKGPTKQDSANESAKPAVAGFRGGLRGSTMGSSNSGALVWSQKAVMPEPNSAVASTVINALGNDVDLQVSTTLNQLPGILSEAAMIPVLIDDRGLAFAELQADQVKVEFNEQAISLQTALRRILKPLGLKAVVESEGLVITADPSSLVHKGIGVSRWINVDEDAEQKIAAALDAETAVEFVELPLSDAIDEISEMHDLQILVDRRALEEIGLSSEEPLSITVDKLKLGSTLALMLRKLDLTYTMQRESLVVTTLEAAEQRLLNRIYWLEGTGYANGDFQSIMDSVQTTITPDTWESLGGPSTMSPLGSIRPAIMISATYTVHEQINQFFQALRESHFGVDPVLETMQVPASAQTVRGFGGGGMGGGFGGGMGGGGMF